jgi:hypothetical protein
MSTNEAPYYAREMAAYDYARHVLDLKNIDHVIAKAREMAHTTVYDFPTSICRVVDAEVASS